MAEVKTKKNDASVTDFLYTIEDEQKRRDSFELVDIFEEMTGEKAVMRGKNIVGFGMYHYKSKRSSQEADWMLTGFSPRKAQLSLYIMPGFQEYSDILEKLGKHKISTGCCLYIKKLDDIDRDVLKTLIKTTYIDMKEKHAS